MGNKLLRLEAGQGAGPGRSGFGLHLVRVDDVVAGRLPELEHVRERVKRDWAVVLQDKLKDDAYSRIRTRYDVKIEDREATIAAAIAAARGEVSQ